MCGETYVLGKGELMLDATPIQAVEVLTCGCITSSWVSNFQGVICVCVCVYKREEELQ